MRVLGGQIQIWLLAIFTISVASGCSNDYQEITVTLEEFRFSPAQVHLMADQPIRLVLRNQGRELHRFTSSVLSVSNVIQLDKTQKLIVDPKEGLAVAAGKSVKLEFFLDAGTYGFRCSVRGHRGMSGVFVVEEAGRE